MNKLFLLLLLCSSQIYAKDIFVQCYDSQIEIIKEAKFNAINLLTNSIETGRNFDKWFEGYDPKIIKNNLQIIKSAIISNDNVYDCSCKREDIYAGIFRRHPYIIYLCQPFWKTKKLGIDSQAGTIIHEFSHFVETINSNDIAQDYDDSLILSKIDKAINNANNYEYLCEEN